jgi:hypothetical protein
LQFFAVVRTRDLTEEGYPKIKKHDGINKLTAANPVKIRVRVMRIISSSKIKAFSSARIP